MKMTYLINSYRSDGSTELVETTYKHWHEIVDENKKVPRDKRRYFYADVIAENDHYDCIVMEVSATVFYQWSNETRAARRNLAEMKKYSHISWEILSAYGDDCMLMSDTMETSIINAETIAALKSHLAAWKPWATAVWDLFLEGNSKQVGPYLVHKYGIGESTARRYKHQFKNFVKNFILD